MEYGPLRTCIKITAIGRQAVWGSFPRGRSFDAWDHLKPSSFGFCGPKLAGSAIGFPFRVRCDGEYRACSTDQANVQPVPTVSFPLSPVFFFSLFFICMPGLCDIEWEVPLAKYSPGECVRLLLFSCFVIILSFFTFSSAFLEWSWPWFSVHLHRWDRWFPDISPTRSRRFFCNYRNCSCVASFLFPSLFMRSRTHT